MRIVHDPLHFWDRKRNGYPDHPIQPHRSFTVVPGGDNRLRRQQLKQFGHLRLAEPPLLPQLADFAGSAWARPTSALYPI